LPKILYHTNFFLQLNTPPVRRAKRKKNTRFFPSVSTTLAKDGKPLAEDSQHLKVWTKFLELHLKELLGFWVPLSSGELLVT